MRKFKAIKLTEISIQTLTLHTNCQKQNNLYYRIAGFLAPLNTIYVCACIYTHLHKYRPHTHLYECALLLLNWLGVIKCY